MKSIEEKRNLSVKKLPGIFKKSYSEKTFEKKILNKLCIPQDKDFVKNIFAKGCDKKKSDFYSVNKELCFTKKEIKKYKLLAKQIKKQHGRIKFLPLIAVVAALFLLAVFVTVFKNPLAKKVIVSSCQSIFGAKTEVESVNVSFLSSSITVKNLAVGNKESVMKNLFEAEKIEADFSLVQALKGSFVAQNLEVSGMLFNTDRTSSCALPVKEKKQKSQEENKFMLSLTNCTDQAVKEIKEQSFNVLGGSDVDSIVKNLEEQLQTPKVVLETKQEVEDITSKWTSKPEKLKNQLDSFSLSMEDLKTLNIQKNDKSSLQDALKKINAAITQSEELKKSFSSVIEDVKLDSAQVTLCSAKIQNATKEDKNLAEGKLTAVKNAVENSKSIITNSMNTFAYDMLGKVYPYILKAVDFGTSEKTKNALSSLKSSVDSSAKNKSKGAKKEKKTKSVAARRLSGTTYWYSTKAPKFLIERAFASGEGFSAEITNLSSNQDISNAPTVLNAAFNLNNVNHMAEGVFDIRTSSSEPVLKLTYQGNGFKTDFDGTKIAQKSGLPVINSTASLSASLSADENSFDLTGSASLFPLTLSSDGFESTLMTDYYLKALQTVNKMNLSFDGKYTSLDGLNLVLGGNFADVFASTLASLAQNIGLDAKKAALNKLNEEINSNQNQVLALVKEFTGIENEINLQNKTLEDLQNTLEEKKTEIEKKLKSSAADAIIKSVGDTAGADEETKAKASESLKKKFGL